MIEVKIGKKTFSIDEEMNVAQYQRLQVLNLLEKPEPAKLLAAYLNIPLSELKNASREQVAFVERFVFNRLTQDVDKNIIFTFDYNNTTYGFENNWGKLAWGAWQDLEFLTSQDITANIHKILAVLYRPVTSIIGKDYEIQQYDAETIEKRAELFKNIPIKIWFGAAQLFFLIANEYINNIKSSTELKMKINKWTMVGARILPKWLKKRLLPDSTLTQAWNLHKMI
jgi:hypothetical protein